MRLLRERNLSSLHILFPTEEEAADCEAAGLFMRDSLPEIERLMRDSRSAAQEFRELSRSLKADPSQLLYEPSYKGVEIPR